jgi:hypothetical protein
MATLSIGGGRCSSAPAIFSGSSRASSKGETRDRYSLEYQNTMMASCDLLVRLPTIAPVQAQLIDFVVESAEPHVLRACKITTLKL